MIRSAYLAPAGLEAVLAEELRRAGVAVAFWHGRLALSSDPPSGSAWALDVWTVPQEIAAPSVKRAGPPSRASLKLFEALTRLGTWPVQDETALDLGAAPGGWTFAVVQRWIAAGAAGHIVCTLKFQDATDHDAASAFAAIPGGRLMHLFHTRHELTFCWRPPDA